MHFATAIVNAQQLWPTVGSDFKGGAPTPKSIPARYKCPPYKSVTVGPDFIGRGSDSEKRFSAMQRYRTNNRLAL